MASFVIIFDVTPPGQDANIIIPTASSFVIPINKMISRLSYTDFDGKNFMSKINLETSIDNDLIIKYAPKVVEGIKRLKEWGEIA